MHLLLKKKKKPSRESYREISPGSKTFKRIYLSIILWFMGRAIQATARVDKTVKAEFDALPDGFTFSLGVFPDGPCMVLSKNIRGRVKSLGRRGLEQPMDVRITIKNIEAAILLFTFQESTAISTSRDRLIVDGDLSQACAVIRILDIVEVYLMPKIIARLAVKRYPTWPMTRKMIGRIRIYFRAVLGY